nr:MAG TPA: hypothetical protein [Caudoviricetes sp.]
MGTNWGQNIKKDNKNLFFCKNEVNKNNYW